MAIVTLEFVKQYLNITTTDLDFKIESLIPKVEEDYLNIRGCPFYIEDGIIVYPIGANITATEMIAYKLANSSTYQSVGKTIQSESIDAYKVSFESSVGKGSGGYPDSITGSIKKYTRWQ